MCCWRNINYGSGHSFVREEKCSIQLKQPNLSFSHSVPCQLIDIELEQSKWCQSCLDGKTQPVTAHDLQKARVLAHDDRDTLPSQAEKKTLDAFTKDLLKRKTIPDLPIESLPLSGVWVEEPIIKTKREFKIWKGLAQLTAEECEREEALGLNPFPTIVPHEPVKDKDGRTWASAPVYFQKEYRQQYLDHRYLPLQLQVARPGQLSSSGLGEKPFHSHDKAASRQEAELFLSPPSDLRISNVPVFLAPCATGTAALEYTVPTADLQPWSQPFSTQGEASPPQPKQAANASKPLPTLLRQLAKQEPISPLPPQIPAQKRISPLHFEGTVLEALAALAL